MKHKYYEPSLLHNTQRVNQPQTNWYIVGAIVIVIAFVCYEAVKQQETDEIVLKEKIY